MWRLIMSKRVSKYGIFVLIILILVLSILIFKNTIVKGIVNEKGIVKIDIFKSSSFNNINDILYTTIIDRASIKTIVRAINNSKKIPGTLEVAVPDYKVIITYKDNKIVNVFLWLHSNYIKGMCMLKDNTSTGYSISETDTKRLIAVLRITN